MMRIAVVDDHEVFRLGVVATLQAHADLHVVGEATSARTAARVVATTDPHVVLVDVRLDGRARGLDLVAELARRRSRVGSIVLTSVPDDRIVRTAERAGAAGVLMKTVGADELVAAVRRVGRGERKVYCADALAVRHRSAQSSESILEQLTPREQNVFELIGRGCSNRQIANQLFLSEKTIKNHMSKLLAKLDMTSRTEVAVLSARLGERQSMWAGEQVPVTADR